MRVIALLSVLLLVTSNETTVAGREYDSRQGEEVVLGDPRARSSSSSIIIGKTHKSFGSLLASLGTGFLKRTQRSVDFDDFTRDGFSADDGPRLINILRFLSWRENEKRESNFGSNRQKDDGKWRSRPKRSHSIFRELVRLPGGKRKHGPSASSGDFRGPRKQVTMRKTSLPTPSKKAKRVPICSTTPTTLNSTETDGESTLPERSQSPTTEDNPCELTTPQSECSNTMESSGYHTSSQRDSGQPQSHTAAQQPVSNKPSEVQCPSTEETTEVNDEDHDDDDLDEDETTSEDDDHDDACSSQDSRWCMVCCKRLANNGMWPWASKPVFPPHQPQAFPQRICCCIGGSQPQLPSANNNNPIGSNQEPAKTAYCAPPNLGGSQHAQPVSSNDDGNSTRATWSTSTTRSSSTHQSRVPGEETSTLTYSKTSAKRTTTSTTLEAAATTTRIFTDDDLFWKDRSRSKEDRLVEAIKRILDEPLSREPHSSRKRKMAKDPTSSLQQYYIMPAEQEPIRHPFWGERPVAYHEQQKPAAYYPGWGP